MTNAWIDWFHIFIIQVNTNNIVMWEILLSNADWDCFRTLILREILKIQNPLLEERCASLEVIHLFQSVGCARNKVSHSPIESEIISLDAGLSLDGLPALDLWDMIVAVLHGNTYQSNQERGDLCSNLREVRAAPHKLQKRKNLME